MKPLVLDAGLLAETVERLGWRIHERFPDSGLERVCRQLHTVAQRSAATARWVARPHWPLRVVAAVLIVGLVVSAVAAVAAFELKDATLGLIDFITLCEAALNELVMLAVAVFFFVTMETRIKRRRVMRAVRELRTIAHLIDAHQLDKDPEAMGAGHAPTAHSPVRTMSPFELGRYLDYCTEMLSLAGKLAALYVQEFDDTQAVSAVGEFEAMSTGLSRKIWQKIMLLSTQPPVGA